MDKAIYMLKRLLDFIRRGVMDFHLVAMHRAATDEFQQTYRHVRALLRVHP